MIINSSEFNSIFINEGENYKRVIEKEVIPYLNSIMQDGYIEGENENKNYYRKYLVENSIGSIVIAHGFGEFIEKFNEVIYYFSKYKFNVFIMEHRGHGRSGKLGVKDKTQVNVENFDFYVSDLKTFIDEVVKKNSDENLFLFAHSMGGAISAQFFIKHPEYFKAAVLESPMMTVNTGNFSEASAYLIAKSAVALGLGGKYVLGNGPYDPEHTLEHSGTSSMSRFVVLDSVLKFNEELQRGGPSFKWLKEAIKAVRYITAEESASKVKVPVLLFQAGKDTFVKDRGQNKFAEYAEKCEIIRVAESKHEFFRETDCIVKVFMQRVIEFYNKNIS